MFAAPIPHPLTGTVLVIVLLSGLVLLVGAILARRWRGIAAVWVRGSALAVAVGVTAAFEVLTPSTVLESLGRMLSLWPATALAVLFFGIWVWRGRAVSR